MTGKEMAIYAHALRITADSISREGSEILGPHEGTEAAQAVNALALKVEQAAGRKLVQEVLTSTNVVR
jgi:hypothetical protein